VRNLSYCCVVVVTFCQVSLGGDSPPVGFHSLFNGRDFSGWHGMPTYDPVKLAAQSEKEQANLYKQWNAEIQSHWKVEEGVIVNDGKGSYLTTDKSFSDYELLVDFKLSPKGDSGIYLKNTPQVQIWDFTEAGGRWSRGADKGSGGLFNNQPDHPGKDPLVLADHPIGEWNTIRVIQVGARTSVWLNGKLVVNHALLDNYFNPSKPIPKTGEIQLQAHGAETWWRNIFIREIPTEEANKILHDNSGEDFTAIFNGKDLTGWQGKTEFYNITDGVLQNQEGKNGLIFTEKEYRDFVLRLQFKIPPKGNSGIAIRYPGEGEPAYTGMCEVKIMDSEHPEYQMIDPRQAHGSVYGKIPATRGYLRDTGEWNFQVVTVKDSKVTVELNGSVILDGDIAGVIQMMNNAEHPGKNRTAGFIGLVGSSVPVELKQIELKEIQ